MKSTTALISFAKTTFERCLTESLLDGRTPAPDREKAKRHFEGACAYCGDKSPRRWDHIVPVRDWGEATTHNLAPACQSCDDSKGKKPLKEWLLMDVPTPAHPGKRLSLNRQQLEQRLRLIERWAAVYQAPTKEEILESDLKDYQDLLRDLRGLCGRAEDLVHRARMRQGAKPLKPRARKN